MKQVNSAFDQILAGYVAGDLPEPVRVLVESHLEISGANRSFVTDLEVLAGNELERLPPAGLRDPDAMLAAILAERPAARIAPPRPRAPIASHTMPQALSRFLGRELDAIPWRTLLPGIREYRGTTVDGFNPILYSIRAGKPLPAHTHTGLELTLVLDGAFADESGRYGRGDVAVADDDIDHTPIAEMGRDCICFAVTEAPIRLTGRFSRFFNAFMR
ncbi:ChrR family anti-sigma-E factor [Methyloraptor flagellatus]|uniref:ChrR family anti-sigma-E factor n=1 Tax=Methyloraptor flagellatus TaxID=3162530 RepID=A0AAU7XGJ7_9HYPH